MPRDKRQDQTNGPAADIGPALRELRLQTPAPPQLASLRTAIESNSREGSKVSFFNSFKAMRWPARIAVSLGALALLFALSLLLPFAGGLRHAPKVSAYSGGYVLIFDFGTQHPSKDIHEKGMA